MIQRGKVNEYGKFNRNESESKIKSRSTQILMRI